MASYIVAYDLKSPGQKYECIVEKMAKYKSRWHMQRSVWIINTNHNAEQIYDNLASCIDGNDSLFVGGLTRDAAWSGFTDKVTAWLQRIL